MSRDPQKMKLLAEVQRLAGENIELEAERDTLRKAYDLSNATNSRLVVQLDGLQARVGELEAAIGALSVYVPCAVWGERVLPCLARTPAQSVAHIEAAVLRRVADRYEVVLMLDATDDLRAEADDIEQAAKS
jgi:hypothetical protein